MVLLCFAVNVYAETWRGTCKIVIDGDSLMVSHASGKKEVRLYGIDAPEYNQPYGSQARDCLKRLVLQKELTIEVLDVDSYGRTIAKIEAPEGCVNERLIAEGCAWVYARFCKAKECKAWSSLESDARQQSMGLWSLDDPVAPWDFRNSKRRPGRKPSKVKVSIDGHYRGNTGSRVFHAPGCTYAACKQCTAGFNSIGSALRAGYKPCKKCIDN